MIKLKYVLPENAKVKEGLSANDFNNGMMVGNEVIISSFKRCGGEVTEAVIGISRSSDYIDVTTGRQEDVVPPARNRGSNNQEVNYISIPMYVMIGLLMNRNCRCVTEDGASVKFTPKGIRVGGLMGSIPIKDGGEFGEEQYIRVNNSICQSLCGDSSYNVLNRAGEPGSSVSGNSSDNREANSSGKKSLLGALKSTKVTPEKKRSGGLRVGNPEDVERFRNRKPPVPDGKPREKARSTPSRNGLVQFFVVDNVGTVLGIALSEPVNSPYQVVSLEYFVRMVGSSINNVVSASSGRCIRHDRNSMNNGNMGLVYEGTNGGNPNIDDIRKVNLNDLGGLPVEAKYHLIDRFEKFTGKKLSKKLKEQSGLGI